MDREHPISSDDELHPALAGELARLRGVILGAAEEYQLPDRFVTGTHPDRAAVVLTDLASGRSTTVPLFAYAAVREVLADLFPEEAP